MTQRTTVPSRPPSALELAPVASTTVALSPVVPLPPNVAHFSPLTLPPDVVRLLEVFARIELRRQLRLRELQEREAS